jgi:hypothetical protein
MTMTSPAPAATATATIRRPITYCRARLAKERPVNDTMRNRTSLRDDRCTVTQLLAAAEKDTDAVSVFMAGCTVADTEAAVFVVKGPQAIAYLRELCKRQGLLTDKPVTTGPTCNLQRPWEAPDA